MLFEEYEKLYEYLLHYADIIANNEEEVNGAFVRVTHWNLSGIGYKTIKVNGICIHAHTV